MNTRTSKLALDCRKQCCREQATAHMCTRRPLNCCWTGRRPMRRLWSINHTQHERAPVQAKLPLVKAYPATQPRHAPVDAEHQEQVDEQAASLDGGRQSSEYQSMWTSIQSLTDMFQQSTLIKF